MTLFSNGVSRSLLALADADRASAKLGQRLITGKNIQSAQDEPSTWVTADRTESAAGLLDVVHTSLTAASTVVGVVDTTMEAIRQDLATASSQLKEAQKFDAGTDSRAQYIANFNSVLQQIDSLVNNTQQAQARNLMTDPGINPQAGDLEVVVGPNGQLRSIHAQELTTGPQGLDVPALDPAGATDADLQAAVQKVRAAQTTLSLRRASLGVDAADLTRYQSQIQQTSDLYESATESLTGADPTETALQLQSLQVRYSLGIETLASISADRNAVLQLLR